MDDLLERLQRRKWRLTPQRRAVVAALGGEHVHLSADEVLHRVRTHRPATSRATVYNTLSELVELGEVAELHFGGRSRRYDPNGAHPHHHFVCEGCGDVRDVHLSADLGLALAQPHRYTVERIDVVFAGRCSDCTS